jgi:hypothetical protein
MKKVLHGEEKDGRSKKYARQSDQPMRARASPFFRVSGGK